MKEALTVINSRLRMLFSSYPTEPVELLIAALLIAWGLAVALPTDTFGVQPAYASFRDTHLPELAWGMLAVVSGVALALGMLLRVNQLRLIGTIATGLFFAFIAASLWVSPSGTTGRFIYTLLAITTAGLYLREAQREARR